MLLLIAKYAITAAIVVAVCEIAKATGRLGALIAAIPLVTTLVMTWLYIEGQETEKISNHAYYTFWYVLPTLPMFLLIPLLLKKGISFPWALAAGNALTLGCFIILAVILKRYEINLLP